VRDATASAAIRSAVGAFFAVNVTSVFVAFSPAATMSLWWTAIALGYTKSGIARDDFVVLAKSGHVVGDGFLSVRKCLGEEAAESRKKRSKLFRCWGDLDVVRGHWLFPVETRIAHPRV